MKPPNHHPPSTLFNPTTFCITAHGLGWAWCWFCWGPRPAAVCWALFTSTLVALSRIDLQHMLLPDVLTLPLLWLGLILSDLGHTSASLSQALWGAVLGYCAFAGINLLHRKMRGTDGLGMGDAKLLSAMLAWLGWQAAQPLVLVACSSALLTAWVLRVKSPMPFGPHLALAGLAMMKFA